MFVSSYRNYIVPNTSDKITKVKSSSENSKKEPFSINLKNNLSAIPLDDKTSLPINYLLSSKTFSNKREVENQLSTFNDKKSNQHLEEFSKQTKFQNAVTSYSANSKSFSLYKIPKISLHQTPKLDTRDEKLKGLQEKALAHKMVNVYSENDKYYKITA